MKNIYNNIYEEDGEIGLSFSICHCNSVFILPPLRVLLCTETLHRHIMREKGVIAAMFNCKSSEAPIPQISQFQLLMDVYICAIPT